MPRRKHHASSGRSLPLVLLSILLIAAVGAGAFVLLRRPAGDGEGSQEPPVPEFSFQLTRERVSSLADEPGERRRDAAVQEVHALLDELYTMAFVDPGAWQGGSFPDLAALFHGEAAERLAEDLDDLSLGSAASRVRRVEPQRSRLTIGLLFDEHQDAVSALAEARFRGRGRTEDGRRLTIEHEGRYLVRRVDQGWRIIGYDVRGELDAAPAGGGGEG